jgi:hypothetical protein
MRRGILSGFALIVIVAAAGACAPRAKVGVTEPPPSITSISPATGPAGTAYPIEVTIAGRNFADSTNVVTFGPVTLRAVRSTAGGTSIVFQAPKEMPSAGEVPPAPLLAGTYSVRVATSAGVSNPIVFVLGREP